MQIQSLSLLAVCPALVIASIDKNGRVGRSEFGMSMILPRQQTTNLQAFLGALGGAAAPAILSSGDPERPFEVDGDTFRDFDTAANRACDNQKNNCADMANNGTGDFKVGDCDQQTEQCKSTASLASAKAFSAPMVVSSDASFDYFCDI
ncbi:hypothetical protein B0J18DRAFT_95260 [Chaetomium sp. MPI-SDFR-AT-0129]|nr:hypothetical protein B0J18DRAFT_95260 [Chaetomium sp. MPI-SDFR-AT-0129]